MELKSDKHIDRLLEIRCQVNLKRILPVDLKTLRKEIKNNWCYGSNTLTNWYQLFNPTLSVLNKRSFIGNNIDLCYQRFDKKNGGKKGGRKK